MLDEWPVFYCAVRMKKTVLSLLLGAVLIDFSNKFEKIITDFYGKVTFAVFEFMKLLKKQTYAQFRSFE